MIQVKIVYGYDTEQLEREINAFLNSHIVIDIKMSSTVDSDDEPITTALIMYKIKEEKR